MELFSRRRWRLISAQSSNKFGYFPVSIVLLVHKHNSLPLWWIWALISRKPRLHISSNYWTKKEGKPYLGTTIENKRYGTETGFARALTVLPISFGCHASTYYSSKRKEAFSVTIWPNYLFNIWPFTNIKYLPNSIKMSQIRFYNWPSIK